MHAAPHRPLDVLKGPLQELIKGDGPTPVLVNRLEEGSPGGSALLLALEHGGGGGGKAVLAGCHGCDVDELVEALGVDDPAHGGVRVGEAAQEVEVEVLVLRAAPGRGGRLQEPGEVVRRRGLDQRQLAHSGLPGHGAARGLRPDVLHCPRQELLEGDRPVAGGVDGLEEGGTGHLALLDGEEELGGRGREAEPPGRRRRDVDEAVKVLRRGAAREAGVRVAEAAEQMVVELLVLG
mmetsp:Transcript_120686/g.352475  ORF Transcript_120686/g.352475 Transcript_120686/m.352475 type:complete len:236 (-) Transcript_120686:22-729(-)